MTAMLPYLYVADAFLLDLHGRPAPHLYIRWVSARLWRAHTELTRWRDRAARAGGEADQRVDVEPAWRRSALEPGAWPGESAPDLQDGRWKPVVSPQRYFSRFFLHRSTRGRRSFGRKRFLVTTLSLSLQ